CARYSNYRLDYW
nr:immunoglobulin heavy chain junction region [Macaca mulatta]MOV49072.1 immunoglobulin heavy chain junction region [Macaca mulatta]MOV49120.1 immunoglobulin heavy chain junction region [Macaca mulatta]MOV49142.1 immunoglobulin heavy chain junction region [Macaca mulatta]MOV49197.1 immunoglobulin heavy chain junction region [Macaca mulatta]